MSPEPKPQNLSAGGQSAIAGGQQPSGEAPRRLDAVDERSQHLPQTRERVGLRQLWAIFAFVGAASAAAFTACGLLQMAAILGHAQEVADDVAAARAAATAGPGPRSQSAPFGRAARVAPDPPIRAPLADTGSGARREDAVVRQDAVLTATGNLSRPAIAATFEAQAEASERVVPVGLQASLDGGWNGLTLGQPPPPSYPRVRCENIFVYIVTIAEGAPQQSSVSIGVGKAGPARFRRPGQSIGDWTVLAISDDWTGINPDVWLEKDGAACQAELAGNAARVHHPPKSPPRAKAARKRRSRK